uniref:Uncharacterized protein n=1 Tax=Anguilla anguilla TaxID=7936 RepID=A0A0E9UDJ4_ANGAN
MPNEYNIKMSLLKKGEHLKYW